MERPSSLASRVSQALSQHALRRRLALAFLALLAVVVLSVTVLHGQSSDQALFIDPKGYVGIGTTTPQAELDVNGKATIRDLWAPKLNVTDIVLHRDLFFGTTGPRQMVTLSSKDYGIGVQGGTTYFRTGKNFAWYKGGTHRDDELNTKADGQIDPDGGTVQMVIKDGDVGIGTASPENSEGWGRVVDVVGSAHAKVSIRTPNADATKSIDGRVMVHDTGGWGAPAGMIIGTKTAHPLSFGTHLAARMTIAADGKVGVGKPIPQTALDVNGGMQYLGRYQRDDDAETTYEISPRYHMSLTGVKYGGKTKTIPQETLVALCGDPDGCQVRLAMTRWAGDVYTEAASVFFMFYYSAANGRWRASATDAGNAEGVDGDRTTKHVRDLYGTCFFTDGTYSNYESRGDAEKGMQLLVWKDYSHPNRTCELTLID